MVRTPSGYTRRELRQVRHWQVICHSGIDTGWAHPVGISVSLIGRAVGSDLRLDDPAVSREHLAIRAHGRRVLIRDLGSTHGTRICSPWHRRLRLRGRRLIGWHRLSPHASVMIGRHELRMVPDWRFHPRRERSPGSSEQLVRLAIPAAMGAMMFSLALSSPSPRMWLMLLMPLVLLTAGVLGWRTWKRSRDSTASSDQTPGVIEGRAAPGVRPLPHELWVVAASVNPMVFHGIDVGNALELPLGNLRTSESIALIGGEGALALLRWIVSQLLVSTDPARYRFHLQLAESGIAHTADAPGTGEHTNGIRWFDTIAHHGPTRLEFVIGGLGSRPPDEHTIQFIVVPDGKSVPPWCQRAHPVCDGHNREIGERYLRELTQTVSRGHQWGDLPAVVPFEELTQEADEGLAASLAATVGVGPSGPVHIDLVREGPHALVAGATGSGKSEFLTTWLMALAMRHRPDRLGLVLIDYKGGATFNALRRLPHVTGLVTDLDASMTGRALTSLTAELRRRERILADHGFSSVSQLPTLGRLLIVVDEFRTLATTHPEHLDTLVRLAAQGRSLGLHLILATQRPAGVVNADIRANTALRICFRVADASESVDVLGTRDAASIGRTPGRGYLAGDSQQVFQSALIGGRLEAMVEQVINRFARRERLRAPWAPPLPDLLEQSPGASTSPQGTPRDTGLRAGLRHSGSTESSPVALSSPIELGLIDLPEQQRTEPLCLPDGFALCVSGTIGRSTTCLTVIASAFSQGRTVAVVGDTVHDHARSALDSWFAPSDSGAVYHRWRQIIDGESSPEAPEVIVIDDLDVLINTWEAQQPGLGWETVLELVHCRRTRGFTLVLATAAHAHKLSQHTDAQLVLRPADRSQATLAGVPRDLSSGPWPAGRGVYLNRQQAHLVQIAHPATPPSAPAGASTHPTPRVASFSDSRGVSEAPRTPASFIPGHKGGETGMSTDQPSLNLGSQHDIIAGRRSIAWLPLAQTITVVGPPRSGRTTSLALISEQLRAAGFTVAHSVDELESVTDPDTTVGLCTVDDRCAPADNQSGHPAMVDQGMRSSIRGVIDLPRRFLVVDDLEHLNSGLVDIAADVGLVVAGRAETLLNQFHGVGLRARYAPAFVFLGRGYLSSQLVGMNLTPYFGSRSKPGQAVIHHQGRNVPVLLHRPMSSQWRS